MPSPFPGMDPYLENPALWPDVHHKLISVIRASLNQQLAPKYLVRIEERLYLSDESDPGRSVIIPDLRVASPPVQEQHAHRSTAAPGVVVAESIEMITLLDDEIHETRLELLESESRSVIAVIEILSPTNKVAGSSGRESYREKRQEILHSPTHLVEIDLLRAGASFLARNQLPTCDYLVHVSRRRPRPRGQDWPIQLQQRLPVIPIPLRPEDPDEKLDLQEALSTAYDRARYGALIDYNADPVPPLRGETATWAAELLKNKGLRKERSRKRGGKR